MTFHTKTSKFEWMLDDIRIEKIVLAPIWVTKLLLEVSALPDVRNCPKLQSKTTIDILMMPQKLFGGFSLY